VGIGMTTEALLSLVEHDFGFVLQPVSRRQAGYTATNNRDSHGRSPETVDDKPQ